MRAAVSKLSCLSGAPENQCAPRKLSFVYADVADVHPNALRWDYIVLDRTNRRWRGLLFLARLFLSDRHQQTSAGAIDSHALLFEMTVFFEAYIERILSRALAGTGFRMSSQGCHRDCLHEGGSGRFRTRPGLIVRQGEKIALIIDTVAKRMMPQVDDSEAGRQLGRHLPADGIWQALQPPERRTALYPHLGDPPPDPIRRQYSIATRGRMKR